MNDEQYKRFKKGQIEPIKIVYKVCKDSAIYFLISGSTEKKYKITITNNKIKCTCPDYPKTTVTEGSSNSTTTTQKYVCKHCCHVLQQLDICNSLDHPFWSNQILDAIDAIKIIENYKKISCKTLGSNGSSNSSNTKCKKI